MTAQTMLIAGAVLIFVAIVVVVGRIAPAARPCTPRKMINVTMLHATAQRTEPARKPATPTSSTGLRPKTSDRRP